jgi:hypothetical protein
MEGPLLQHNCKDGCITTVTFEASDRPMHNFLYSIRNPETDEAFDIRRILPLPGGEDLWDKSWHIQCIRLVGNCLQLKTEFAPPIGSLLVLSARHPEVSFKVQCVYPDGRQPTFKMEKGQMHLTQPGRKRRRE